MTSFVGVHGMRQSVRAALLTSRKLSTCLWGGGTRTEVPLGSGAPIHSPSLLSPFVALRSHFRGAVATGHGSLGAVKDRRAQSAGRRDKPRGRLTVRRSYAACVVIGGHCHPISYGYIVPLITHAHTCADEQPRPRAPTGQARGKGGDLSGGTPRRTKMKLGYF